MHQQFSPFTHLSIHSFSPLINIPFNLSIFPPILSPIYPSIYTHLFSPIQLPILNPAFLPSTYPTFICINSLGPIHILLYYFYTHLPSTYQFTLPSIQIASINRPIHPVTNLTILMFNPIHFFTQLFIYPSYPFTHAPKYPCYPHPSFLFIQPSSHSS